jgi:trehalose 6-phosphate synthase
MGRVVVVSNRVSRPRDPALKGAGGLEVAMAAALRKVGGFWFGWSGDRVPAYTGELNHRRSAGVNTITVDLDEADYEDYYKGYSNSTLWPLFHYRIDLTRYDRPFAEGYQRVNRRFAKALAPLLKPDDLIWVQDYHLIPLARELRRLGVANPIGFFLHIPWPAHQLLTTLPGHRALVQSMFDYDLVGFQTEEWLAAFDAYVLGEAGGSRRADGRLEAFGRTVVSKAFPIGLDTEDFLKLSRSPAADLAYDRMASHSVFRKMIVGVDRLDYSKGIEERLLGFEQYLQDNPEMVRDVLYLQIAPVSRGDVDAYGELRERIWALAGRINAAWADMDRAPMQCVTRNYSRAELAGIYRAAKVGLVTPLRDGMNLVAKEYVAAQDPGDPGVLILSRFAGAAQQMTAALIVNPFSPEELSEALKRALAMGLDERRSRWRTLMDGVVRDDVAAWRDSFLGALKACAEGGRPPDQGRRIDASKGQPARPWPPRELRSASASRGPG